MRTTLQYRQPIRPNLPRGRKSRNDLFGRKAHPLSKPSLSSRGVSGLRKSSKGTAGPYLDHYQRLEKFKKIASILKNLAIVAATTSCVGAIKILSELPFKWDINGLSAILIAVFTPLFGVFFGFYKYYDSKAKGAAKAADDYRDGLARSSELD